MRVIVCATQVPFMRGGAEQHVDNLVGALGAAGHEVEAVRLPTAWDRDHLLDAAVAWRMLPLDADLVIATNFPSYFARHPRKVVWLFHQHRAAYDALGQPWSDFGTDDVSLEAHRQLVAWDNAALAEAERLYSTSQTVADRLARFNGLTATPLYHPPPLAEALNPGPFGRDIVCINRLESNKRPDLFVSAMAEVKAEVRGVLIGRGTLADEIAASVAANSAAKRGAPVELAGFVPDDRLVERLAGALGVVYAPFDEDYGYVTLQAHLAGKPVITTHDAGGVLEFVEHERTGLVAEPTAHGVAEAIGRLAADPELAQRMGEAGRERARQLSWPKVIDTLVGA